MPVQGYPDWQRVATRIPAPLAVAPNIIPSPSEIIGPFYVGNTPFVNVLVVLVGGSGILSCTLEWNENKAFSGFGVNNEIWADDTNGGFRYQFSPLLPWLRLTLENHGSSSLEIDLLVQPTFNAATNPNLTAGILQDATGVAVNAGATETLNSFTVAPGPAVISLTFNANAWILQLQRRLSNGGWFAVGQWNGASIGSYFAQQITLPPYPTRFQFTNNDTAAHNLSLFMGMV